MLNREAYLQKLEEYWRLGYILEYKEAPTKMRTEYWNELNDYGLEEMSYFFYCKLKVAICNLIKARIIQYESNRDFHIPNKTADKAFYRFAQASGIGNEVNPKTLPIRRLIRIYEVYFK